MFLPRAEPACVACAMGNQGIWVVLHPGRGRPIRGAIAGLGATGRLTRGIAATSGCHPALPAWNQLLVLQIRYAPRPSGQDRLDGLALA